MAKKVKKAPLVNLHVLLDRASEELLGAMCEYSGNTKTAVIRRLIRVGHVRTSGGPGWVLADRAAEPVDDPNQSFIPGVPAGEGVSV